MIISYYNSNAQIANVIFPIKPEDQNYLRYLFFRNQFDSAEISCFFGEVRVKTGSSTIRVNLSNGIPCGTVVEGDSAQGENTNLTAYARTENFTMPPGTPQIEFYRSMTLNRVSCDGFGGGAGGGHVGGGGDGNGSFWMIGQGRIQDKTELVTKLIRASDNAILAVIDSMGVNTNPSSDTVFVYGTSPVKTKHIRLLPTGYSGTSVYLQVSPRRYGSTPYGIEMKHYCNVYVNYSATFDSLGMPIFDSLFLDSIPKLQKTLLFNYCDSVITATGHLPSRDILNRFFMHRPIADSFRTRYYDQNIKECGTFYKEKNFGSSKRSDQFETTNKKNGIICANNICKIKDLEIQSIQPNPTSGITGITINAYQDVANATIDVYTLQGQKIARLWTGSLFKGDNKISMNFSDYANGTYGLYCNNQNGETIDFDKVIIAK